MTSPSTVTGAGARSLPPLETGDHLSRAEFERRYQAMPHLKKAELIEGVVHVPSPVRLAQHGRPQAAVMGWLMVYWAHTPGVQVGDNSTVRLDMDTEPQPDALMIIEPARGGQATIDADGYVAGAPEMVVEVAASSASIDLNSKLRVYRRNGVREYVVWRVLDEAIDWFVLRQAEYEALRLNATGRLESEVFPGLWLDPAALIRFDLMTVLRVVQEGVASAAHGAFAKSLQEK